jgi:uncharacterized protein (TIGR03437 family)
LNSQLPFVAKVNPGGKLVYSSLFSNGVTAVPQAIAVDSSARAIISGIASALPATSGAYNNSWTTSPPFVTKLDPTGTKLIFSVSGVGGSSLALDPFGDIYIAGTTSGESFPTNGPQYPTTPGGFQTTYTPIVVCPPTPCMIPITVGQQYVTKLSADGSKLLYSTFVTGSRGSYNAGIAVDTAGDVWLTGDTASPDYPYTQPRSSTSLADTFTTELDPTGSKVLLSVAQGVPPGNGNNLAIDPQGNLIEIGYFPVPAEETSPANVLPVPAPPSTGNAPSQCLPGRGVYALRIGSQDGAVLGTQILPGGGGVSSFVDSRGDIYVAGSTSLPNIPLTPGVFYDHAVTKRTVSGGFLERTNFSLPASPLGCVTDSTNMTILGPVAPGELITIYGNGIGPTQPVIGVTAGASTVPTSLGGVSVTFNGQPAPILYASSSQVNLQAPFEIFDQNPYTTAENTLMQLTYGGSVLGTQTFAVAPQNPGLFVASSVQDLVCGNSQGGNSLIALALNQDGSINSCANPAPSGSQFTLFVNGIGTAANGATGVLAISSESDHASVSLWNGGYSLEVDAFSDQPGALSGIGQITGRVPATILATGPMGVTLNMNGVWAGPLVGGDIENPAASAIPVVVFVKP